jgi:hypothetical protein
MTGLVAPVMLAAVFLGFVVLGRFAVLISDQLERRIAAAESIAPAAGDAVQNAPLVSCKRCTVCSYRHSACHWLHPQGRPRLPPPEPSGFVAAAFTHSSVPLPKQRR